MENNTPTAKEFYQQAMDNKTIGDDITDLMNAYAKMHVEQALKAAAKSAKFSFESGKGKVHFDVYPLNNIK